MVNSRAMNKNIPIFVTHYGCPNQCVFCNQKKISGVSRAVDYTTCEKILKEASLMGYDKELTEIAFFGGSFTGIPRSEQKRYLEIANRYRDSFGGIRLSTRPDYINEEILEFLKAYGVTTIELGVQSMVDEVLLKNRRGMTAEITKKAVKLIRQYDFSLGLQMMVSMYASSPMDDLYTADEILLLKPDFVRIYPTVVLEDTELYHLYQRGEYSLKSLDDTIELVTDIYEKFQKHHIPVIRIGLMSGEEINSQKVIGAYHESFGELVQGELFYRRICAQLVGQEIIGKELKICCHPRKVSCIIGHQKKNAIRLKERFFLKNIKVIPKGREHEDENFILLEWN